MLSPRHVFEDNIRPADLLLKVFRLLEHDAPNTNEEVRRTLRNLVKADDDEDLTVIYNEIFLGLIRERAEVTPASIKRSALRNLLRQSTVTACTAMETYLPSLLRTQLPAIIGLRGRTFVSKDKEITEQFKNLTFNLDECLRLLVNPDPLFIALKLISFVNFSYLSGKRGIHVTGALLGIDSPWNEIAARLGRGEEELKKTLDDTVNRRNDIVHRADREKRLPDGPPQDIDYAWTRQAVDTVRVVCLCLDELVTERLKALREQAAGSQPQGAA
ncbi:MAG TPA: HEPN domain-containing protein [Vicinamibacterales bacterium]|jgi:hypothetical protein